MFKLPWETMRDLKEQMDEDKAFYNRRHLEYIARLSALERQLKQLELSANAIKSHSPMDNVYGLVKHDGYGDKSIMTASCPECGVDFDVYVNGEQGATPRMG